MDLSLLEAAMLDAAARGDRDGLAALEALADDPDALAAAVEHATTAAT